MFGFTTHGLNIVNSEAFPAYDPMKYFAPQGCPAYFLRAVHEPRAVSGTLSWSLGLSKKRQLRSCPVKRGATGGCRASWRAVSCGGCFAVLAGLSMTVMLLCVASLAGAGTFSYELNGSLADSGGPSLISRGGMLGSTGYAFGVSEGFSLPGTRAFDVYSIDIRFYFDDVNASFNTWQKILDFNNRTSDSGLYSAGGSTGSGDLTPDLLGTFLQMARWPTC
jgi:hypothetical protein